MWKAVASNALTLIIVMLFVAAGVVAWSVAQWREPGPLAQAICLEVPGGSSMRSVSEDLAEQGAISSAAVFRAGADYAGKTGALKAGSFQIEAGESMAQIVDQITGRGVSTCGTQIVWRIGVARTSAEITTKDPATDENRKVAAWIPGEEDQPAAYDEFADKPSTQFGVVLVEGVTSWQVREALSGIALLEGELAEIPDEGSLAPDTYYFSQGDSPAGIIERMQAAQTQRLADIWAGRSDRAVVTSPEDALILASIIEKETGVPGERRQVSAVFSNRLRQGMRLQTDPTVIYGVTGGQGVLGRGLRRSELDRETPYNTYVISGLPPTPIANPGLESLRAAVDPSEDDYLFFVADGTGGHAFATTLDEHNRNVARWRAIEAAQGGGG